MPRTQGNRASWATMGGILLVSASALGLAGCGSLRAERVEAPAVERRTANRDQLLHILDEQSQVLRVAATTRVTIRQEGAVVPATVIDAVRKQRSKPYQKKFAEAFVNGSFFLSRDGQGHLDVSVSGEVEGVSEQGFTLLAKDRSFWMLIPTSEEERQKVINEGVAAPRAKVLYGKFEPDAIRPRDRYSIRPQDFANLLLIPEARLALDGRDICYVEAWRDYYVMNFLRPDWPNHIYSKVWVERDQLTVAIHQLFDSAGELVAEARFRGYARYAVAKGGKAMMDMPTHVDFLWPRDRIMMQTELADIKLNNEIPSKVFDPKRFEGYPTEQIEALPER